MKDRTIICDTAELFIVPNTILTLAGFSDQRLMKKYLDKLGALNGWDPVGLDTELVEVWIGDPTTLHSDNLISHGFDLPNGDHCSISRFHRNLPVHIFEGKKEHDVIPMKIPIYYNNEDHTEVMETKLHLEQLKYRYAMGTFEEVLAKLKN